jgi:hypothetical protein
MKKYLVFCIWYFVFGIINTFAQNKSGNVWIIGWGGMNAVFTDTARPIVGQISTSPTIFPYNFAKAQSNICDSATGKLLLITSGMHLFDSIGNIIDNGDSLQPSKIYGNNNPPQGVNTQGSLILPKGNDGEYYVFTATITDTTYTKFKTSTIKFPFDLLQYHVVDMKANGGMGKVIQKNIPLIENNEISWVGMMAVRHSNGYDWWLLKQGFDTNKVYTFLVTKDTVLLDTIQYFAEPSFGLQCGFGQSCFSKDGSKYAVAMGGHGRNLFLADFDRCYGILSNTKSIKIPIDSTTDPFYQSVGVLDSIINGVCFSPNDSFIYVTKRYNIYQYELNNIDSTSAWINIKHGEDTTYQFFSYYGQLYRGIDNRIYIGKFGGQGKQMSVIDYPNLKGTASGFCRMCLRNDNGLGYIGSPPNMPDFNLSSKTCFPLTSSNLSKGEEQLQVYPNPSSTIIKTSPNLSKGEEQKIYSITGQLIISTKENTIDVRNLPKAIYFLQRKNVVKKVIIE